VKGRHAVHPRVTLGILEVAGELTKPPSRVTLSDATGELMVFEVAWG